jgi:hypothetical protein
VRVNWELLSDIDFTRFCNQLLFLEVSTEVRPFDVPGRDGLFDAEFNGAYTGRSGHWLFQYKLRRAVTRSQAYREIQKEVSVHLGEMTNRGISADFVLFCTNLHLNRNEMQKLESMSATPPVFVWDGSKLESFMAKYPILWLYHFERATTLITSDVELAEVMLGGETDVFDRSEADAVLEMTRKHRLVVLEGHPLTGKTFLVFSVARKWLAEGNPIAVLRPGDLSPSSILQLKQVPGLMCIADGIEGWDVSSLYGLMDLNCVLVATRTVGMGGHAPIIGWKSRASSRADVKWESIGPFDRFGSFVRWMVPERLVKDPITITSLELLASAGNVCLPGIVSLFCSNPDLGVLTPDVVFWSGPPEQEKLGALVLELTQHLPEGSRRLMRTLRLLRKLLQTPQPYSEWDVKTLHRALYGEDPGMHLDDLRTRGLLRKSSHGFAFWSTWHLDASVSISNGDVADAAVAWHSYTRDKLDHYLDGKDIPDEVILYFFVLSRLWLHGQGSSEGIIQLAQLLDAETAYRYPEVLDFLQRTCWICQSMSTKNPQLINDLLDGMKDNEVLHKALLHGIGGTLFGHAQLGDSEEIIWLHHSLSENTLSTIYWEAFSWAIGLKDKWGFDKFLRTCLHASQKSGRLKGNAIVFTLCVVVSVDSDQEALDLIKQVLRICEEVMDDYLEVLALGLSRIMAAFFDSGSTQDDRVRSGRLRYLKLMKRAIADLVPEGYIRP